MQQHSDGPTQTQYVHMSLFNFSLIRLIWGYPTHMLLSIVPQTYRFASMLASLQKLVGRLCRGGLSTPLRERSQLTRRDSLPAVRQ